jgi:AcrR family transcriptional regulator
MIIDAVLPLLMEHGRAVTTRQIADAAGIAEGTVFRAFGDKESLIAAAVERFLDPTPLRDALRGIDRSLTLEQKLGEILFHIRGRFAGVFGIMNALGMQERPPIRDVGHEYAEIIDDVLSSHLDELRVSPEIVTRFIRIIAFSTAIPAFSESVGFSEAELAAFIRLGIAGVPAEGRGDRAS